MKLKLSTNNFTLVLLYLLLLSSFSPGVTAKLEFIKPPENNFVLKLYENTTVGEVVYTLEATGGTGNYTFDIQSIGVFLGEIEDNQGKNTAKIKLMRPLVPDFGKFGCHVTSGSEFVSRSVITEVIDINNHPPIFDQNINTTMDVGENYMPPNGLLFTVIAYDETDLGDFGTRGIIFKLQNNDPLFSISTQILPDKAKCNVYLVKPFDYEASSLYRVTIIAMDNKGQDPSMSSSITITINVNDMDDQGPTFTRIPPITKLYENLPEGTPVFDIKAVDGDKGVNNPIVYSIIEGNEDDVFEINATSGQVVLAKSPDRESLDVGQLGYILTIMAQEIANGNLGLNITVDCTVIILDVNDEAPKFDKALYFGHVTENSFFNTPIKLIGVEFITVTDFDESQNANFMLKVFSHSDLFFTHPGNGISQAFLTLRVNDSKLLDYETLGSGPLIVEIEAEDIHNSSLKSNAQIQVTIDDANDQYPQFSESFYQCNISEDAIENDEVCTITAFDNDTGIFGTFGIRYSILGSQDKIPFKIDSVTGIISVTKNNSLDYEKINQYFLAISARDDEDTGNFNSTEVVINLIDVNDNYPIFTSKAYRATYLENEKQFQSPLFIKATDKDSGNNGKVKYKIEDNGMEKYFELVEILDDEMVELIPKSTLLDYEQLCAGILQKCFLNITINATDLGIPNSLSSSADVVVTFIDVNDNKPIFVVDSISVDLNETDTGGTFVGQVNATDADVSKEFNTVTYQIISGSDNLFTINSTDGRITVVKNAVLDLGDKHEFQYQLIVIARDGLYRDDDSTCTVNVTIFDVNNKPPKFIDHPYEATISENATVGDKLNVPIAAEDVDKNNDLQYSFGFMKAYSPGGVVYTNEKYYDILFKIDPNNGSVSVNSELDRETVEKIIITLKVTDLNTVVGVPTATAQLTIIIEDENDNAPWFGQNGYYSEIRENLKINTAITPSVYATDRDFNQNVTFSIEDPDVLKLININPQTGVLKVVSNIDRELNSSLNFTVIAKDDGYPSLSNETWYYIKILDENDNKPIFDAPDTYNVNVSEDTNINTSIFNVSATDEDEGDYGTISYFLSKDQQNFAINIDTGEITVKKKLDCDNEPAIVHLIVEAHDDIKNTFHQSSSATVTVTLLDVNDNSPIINSHNKACETVKEDEDELYEIVEISGIDPDQGENGTIIFSLAESNSDLVKELFDVKSSSDKSAMLFVKKSLRGYVREFEIVITARDNGSPILYTEKNETYTVCVKDVNDNDPIIHFPSQNEIIYVNENIGLNEEITRVIATDNDTDELNKKLVFTLTSYEDVFKIIERTGSITVIEDLKSRSEKWYELNFKVCDSGTPPRCASPPGKCRIVLKSEFDKPPYFQETKQEISFTEETEPGLEKRQLNFAIDDDDDVSGLPEEVAANRTIYPICYYIVAGNVERNFYLNRTSRVITTQKTLDFETKPEYTIYVYATNECSKEEFPIGGNEDLSSLGNSYLRVTVVIKDINDHGPKFTQQIFGGGIDNQDRPGQKVLQLNAVDADTEQNAEVNYFISSDVTFESTDEGSELKPNNWFTLNENNGEIQSNYQFSENMKGYIHFEVMVNNTLPVISKNNNETTFDRARVKIYVLRKDQKSSFIIRQTSEKFWSVREDFARKLSNLTGHTALINGVEVYVDPTTKDTRPEWCEVFVHYVDDENNVVNPSEIENFLDSNIEAQTQLNQEFSVFEVKKLTQNEKDSTDIKTLAIYGAGIAVIFLLAVVLGVYCAKYSRLQRQLKVSQISSYNADEKRAVVTELPNTNLHAMQGSNPIYSVDNDIVKHQLDNDTESTRSEGSLIGDEDNFEGGKNNGGFAAMLESMFANEDEQIQSDNFENTKNEKINDALNDNFIMKKHPEATSF